MKLGWWRSDSSIGCRTVNGRVPVIIVNSTEKRHTVIVPEGSDKRHRLALRVVSKPFVRPRKEEVPFIDYTAKQWAKSYGLEV